MSAFKVVFLGTPDFAVASLEHLLGDEQFDVVAVISQPDRPAGRKMLLQPSPVKQLALSRGLRVFTPETVNTDEFRDIVRGLGAESAVVVAFGQILGQKFLDLFSLGCVNVHGSLLPRWRGAAPIQRAIMAGDRETGVALQMIVRKLDAGPVLGERRVTLTDDIDAMQLHDHMKPLSGELLSGEYADYLRGDLTPHEQDESLVTIAPKIDKSEARIDWRRSARDILNQVRGLAMGPSAFAVRLSRDRSAQVLKIHKARVIDETAQRFAVGSVCQVTEQSFVVQCGSGWLEILSVQPESRARQSAEEYLRGHSMASGTQFEIFSEQTGVAP